MWGLGCILYILLYGSNPFMQINDSETLCRILDCTFSTPPRPSISEEVIDLIKALLQRDPNTRLTIQQVLAHPWLQSEDVEFSDDKSVSPKSNLLAKAGKTNLHDSIIEQMLSRGMGTRDNIEKALKENTEKSNSEFEEIMTNVNGNLPDDNITHTSHKHYIKATYNLLRDKFIREHNVSSSNGKSTSPISHHKRVLPPKPRKHLFQQQKARMEQPLPEVEDEGKEKENNSDNIRSLNQVEIMHEEDNGVVLPLARKCSIVSEESSCAADSDLSCYDLPTRICHDDSISNRAFVNIIVTDCSEIEESDGPEEQDSSVTGTNEGPENEAKTSFSQPFVKTQCSSLHLVSSSPELLCSSEDQDLDSNEFDNNRESTSSHRPATMVLSSETCNESDGVNITGINNSSSSATATSMRIIVQSKSCNILFRDDSRNSKKKFEKTKTNVRRQSKSSRSDRNDCCVLC